MLDSLKTILTNNTKAPINKRALTDKEISRSFSHVGNGSNSFYRTLRAQQNIQIKSDKDS